ncbi:TolC family protein [Roseateles koreensis]|uniref:TolC family protein n=1 Tax=Roseateles koreensis TaxID=2987526 RepID=A0ABT5KVG5_9BURK|nr:TolC family protein [Roseateles koreensis]MDC8786919.1 TolC family protein [Roseateles koreensis]
MSKTHFLKSLLLAPRFASLLVLACAGPCLAQGRCNEDESAAVRLARDTGGSVSATPETSTIDPRQQLQDLVALSLRRSNSMGAIRLLTLAAEADVEEAKAARLPTVNLVGSGAYVGNVQPGQDTVKGSQARGSLMVSAPLFDFGRITKMTEWRTQLAEVAKLGQSAAEEQLALQTISLALDRSRYVLQAQVYSQYVRRMSCLVDSLEVITKADRGRASELVQAQKSLQQADLSYEGSLSALRQTEVRLRRFVGEQLPPSAPMSNVLARLPDLNEMQQDILSAPDINQASATAKASRSYAESVLAGQKPSVNLTVGTNSTVGTGKETDWNGGVQVNIPLYQPGADATLMAAHRRAQSALLQRDDAIEAKRYRLLEVYEVASSALDRARRVVDILRNSDKLRSATLQQWQQLGKRSLFDVMGAEGDYYANRVAHVNALFDAEQAVALMWSMGRGVQTPLR